jgi:hypothetical protein
VSSKPNKPIDVVIQEFRKAWNNNDSASITTAEKELDKIVRKRIRRLSYADYPQPELEKLLEILPEEYARSDVVYALLVRKSRET